MFLLYFITSRKTYKIYNSKFGILPELGNIPKCYCFLDLEALLIKIRGFVWLRPPHPHSGPFQGVTLHVLEIKKIYQCIVYLSVLKLEKRYLHQNGGRI